MFKNSLSDVSGAVDVADEYPAGARLCRLSDQLFQSFSQMVVADELQLHFRHNRFGKFDGIVIVLLLRIGTGVESLHGRHC